MLTLNRTLAIWVTLLPASYDGKHTAEKGLGHHTSFGSLFWGHVMMALSCLNYHANIGSEVVIILIVVVHIGEVVTSRCHGSKISGCQKTENVSKKVNSHCFELHRNYLVSFNLSNVGEIF